MTQVDFVDSHAPFDFDPERDEAWSLRSGESLEGKFDQPRSGIHWPSFWNGFWYGLNPLNSLRVVRGWLRG